MELQQRITMGVARMQETNINQPMAKEGESYTTRKKAKPRSKFIDLNKTTNKQERWSRKTYSYLKEGKKNGSTNTNIHPQHRGFAFIHIMGAHKHHHLVCLHTPQCSPINANPHNLLTKLPLPNTNSHNLFTKLLLSYSPVPTLTIHPLTYHQEKPSWLKPKNKSSYMHTLILHSALQRPLLPLTITSPSPPTNHQTTHTTISKTSNTY